MNRPIASAGNLMEKSNLARFRGSHPVKTAVAGEMAWEYISCGQGTDTLVLLQGAGGVAEAAFERILRFEPYFRIIAPSYPAAAASMQQLLDGLEGILDSERVEQAHLLGSFAGRRARGSRRLKPRQQLRKAGLRRLCENRRRQPPAFESSEAVAWRVESDSG